jgi:hypothetical protein
MQILESQIGAARTEARLMAAAAATSSEQLNQLPLSGRAALLLHHVDP